MKNQILFAEETYRFAGVDVEKDLNKTISGEKTFDDVTISGNLNTRGGKVVP